ncbi:MAG: CDP-alcohol phosphatidyltransferase family protein, partial [Fidelibacterota bacterium]
NAGLFVHWYSDSLDGTLARVRHVERERYGYFVDHMSDTWTTFSICLGIGLSPLMRMDVALFLATGYLMVSSYAHIAAYVRRVFVLSYGRFGPTEVRIIIALLNTTMIFWNPVVGSYRGGIFTAVDLGGVVLGIILLLIFAGVAIRDAKELDGGGPEEPGEDNVATQGRKI